MIAAGNRATVALNKAISEAVFVFVAICSSTMSSRKSSVGLGLAAEAGFRGGAVLRGGTVFRGAATSAPCGLVAGLLLMGTARETIRSVRRMWRISVSGDA